jgi:hypothetical protein
MKIRLVVPLVGLAISFAMPGLALEQNTVDPEIRQQIEAALRSLMKHSTKTMRLLLQPCTRRTRLRCGRNGRQVGWLWVNKPSRKGMQPTSHRIPASSPTACSGACDRQRNMRDLRMEYAADQNQRRPLRSNDLCS